MVDQMTEGRTFAGFARGYQRRWVDTLAQHYDTLGDSVSDPARYEALKRETRATSRRLILKAWTNATFSHQGKHWTIPPRGDIPWAAADRPRVGRGVDAGHITEIGIAPRCFQKPHPPLFQPFASSERTIRFLRRGRHHADPAAGRHLAPANVVQRLPGRSGPGGPDAALR